jgi:protein-S-isoprenylcysteine O-methyltransferase Ste14
MIQRWMPITLTVAAILVLGSLAVWRVLSFPSREQQAFVLVFLVMYVAWMMWESRVSIREIDKPEADNDRGTLELAAAAKIILLVSAIAGPTFVLPRRWFLLSAIVALGLLVGGVLLRVAAIRALDKNYSHRIRTPVLPPIAHGPYASIRHPAYAGTLLVQMGVVCILPNWYAVAALAAWFVVVGLRTRLEDQWLQQFEQYRTYCKEVPGVWLPPLNSWTKLQSRLPIGFSVAFVALIVLFFWRKLPSLAEPLDLALSLVIAAYLAWILIESATAVAEIDRERTKIDRGTMELYAFGRAATVLTALGFPTSWSEFGFWYPLGATLFLGGVILRLAAIRTLGTHYSYRVRIPAGHVIVDRGPYRVLRHPAYAGMILAHTGFVICFFHPVSLAVLLLWFVPAVLLRIRVEERALATVPGYKDYAYLRKRLIPLVW